MFVRNVLRREEKDGVDGRIEGRRDGPMDGWMDLIFFLCCTQYMMVTVVVLVGDRRHCSVRGVRLAQGGGTDKRFHPPSFIKCLQSKTMVLFSPSFLLEVY